MSVLQNGRCDLVLFDLDGTLIDTAPDMVAVLRLLQESEGVEPVDHAVARAHVSNGAIGLLRLGFPQLDDAGIELLRPEYLAAYAGRICDKSSVFDGLCQLLATLESAEIAWGVVTNKPHALTMPLMACLGLVDRAACIVSGDTLARRKPDPAPLLHACELAGYAATNSVYVGDASRDIEAGRAAGMATVAAAYGYITPGDDPAAWEADAIAATTEELAQIVLKAVNLDA